MIALGIALIFGIVGMINFAHGELIMIGGFTLVVVGAVSFPILVVAAVVVVALAALTMERAAFRPVRGADPATLLVTSFAVSFMLQNLALLIAGPRSKGVDVLPSLQDAVAIGDVRIQKLNLAIILTTAALVVLLDLFLRRTSLGLQLRAAAENFESARRMGVRANLVIAVAFAISGILAGVAAIFVVAQGGAVYPAIGLPPLIIAFVAVVIGGLYSLRGAVVGSVVLAFVTVALQAWLPADLQQFVVAFTYSVVLVILLVRPEGIVASRSLRGRVG